MDSRKKRRKPPINYVREQTEQDAESSCYKCPYRSRDNGMKCFPCMRHLLGDHIPEMEENEDEQNDGSDRD